MLSGGEISEISERFGKLYGVDIQILRKDATKLSAIISERSGKKLSSVEIYANSVTPSCPPASALLDDLETFEFQEIKADPRLDSARIEQNLDDAIRYAENCLQVRRQYSEMGKLRNDTRFKFEEFFRQDLVHLDEVAAGLYELPRQEAEAEKDALSVSVEQARLRLENVSHILDSTLSPNRLERFIDNESTIAANTAARDADDVLKTSSQNAEDRTQLEDATWKQTLSSSNENLSHANIRFAAAEKKASYLVKDVAFRTYRAAISRNLAWLQISEHCRENSALNYEERLSHQRQLFSENLRHLVERIIPLAVGIKEYYGIGAEFKSPKKGMILDEVTRWLVEIQDELSKYKGQEEVVICQIFSSQSIEIGQIKELGDHSQNYFEVDLKVDESNLPAGKSLLRGVNFEFFGTQEKPISLEVIPPEGALPSTSNSTNSRIVRFGRVCPFTAALDLKPYHVDIFWNGSAQGIWKVRGVHEGEKNPVRGLVMHVWIATLSQ